MAVYEQKVIGYLKINSGPAQTELQDQKAIEIERNCVLKELHGNKSDIFMTIEQLGEQG